MRRSAQNTLAVGASIVVGFGTGLYAKHDINTSNDSLRANLGNCAAQLGETASRLTILPRECEGQEANFDQIEATKELKPHGEHETPTITASTTTYKAPSANEYVRDFDPQDDISTISFLAQSMLISGFSLGLFYGGRAATQERRARIARENMAQHQREINLGIRHRATGPR